MKQITLKQARRNAGLTQEALEELAGVTQATISAIESGRVQDPGFQIVCKLARVLDVDPRRLRLGVKKSEQEEVA